MALKRRIVKVTLSLPDQDVILDEKLFLNIRVRKATHSAQSQATIDAGGLTQELREALLSQFSAYKKRLRESGDITDGYINVLIEVGYEDGSETTITPIFHGQVVLCEPASPAPNIITRITCYTQQIDKTKYHEVAPDRVTFKAYCEWAAGQMGLASHIDTRINSVIVDNPGRTVFTVSGLLWDIQRNYDRQGIAAFVDDNTLYVMDIDKVVKGDPVTILDEFVGTPTWTEWGASFNIMLNQQVKLARGVRLNSKTNPTLGLADMVVTSIEYEIATRSDQFGMKVQASPSA